MAYGKVKHNLEKIPACLAQLQGMTVECPWNVETPRDQPSPNPNGPRTEHLPSPSSYWPPPHFHSCNPSKPLVLRGVCVYNFYMLSRYWRTILALVIGFLAFATYFSADSLDLKSMIPRLQQLARTIVPAAQQAGNMSTANGLPSSWHNGPDDGFHGKITPD